MKVDVSQEIQFRTARSGGKGGQHVNKVETMVEGCFHIESSRLLTEDQKAMLMRKLATRINAAGELQIRSQVHRSQLANKQEVVLKMNALVEMALKKEKKRIRTRPTAQSKEKRLESKKRDAAIKSGRQKFRL